MNDGAMKSDEEERDDIAKWVEQDGEMVALPREISQGQRHLVNREIKLLSDLLVLLFIYVSGFHTIILLCT